MRKRIIAGNWKMHLTGAEATALVAQLRATCDLDDVEVLVCPPFTALAAVREALRGSRIGLGAQDLFWEAQGAFTGEVAPGMLKDAGCAAVIIGHSERRTSFGETDQTVNKKLSAALGAGLAAIVCIGETLAEREAGTTFDVLKRQLSGAFKGRSAGDLQRVVIAYEPVWAIGTGRNATPDQAQEAHAFIRRWVAQTFGQDAAERLRIQYGGSVNGGNAAALLGQPDVDGALVGGASLKADQFSAIVKAALETKAVAN